MAFSGTLHAQRKACDGDPASTATFEIKRQVELIYEALEAFPWDDPKAYAEWLAQTSFYVRRVTHALATGASRTSLEQRHLHEHFLRAISEEKDHDELATGDLKDLGYDIAGFTEHPLTTAFYQTLIYMIEHHGPEVILGYFFVLQGVSGGDRDSLYRRVQVAYGGKTARFLEERVALDPDHFPQAPKILSTLDEGGLALVEERVRLGGAIYRYMIAAIRSESGLH